MMELWIALTFPQALVILAVALVVVAVMYAIVWEEKD